VCEIGARNGDFILAAPLVLKREKKTKEEAFRNFFIFNKK
jgi:hypothetical protein